MGTVFLHIIVVVLAPQSGYLLQPTRYRERIPWRHLKSKKARNEKTTRMKVVRRASELWQKAGQPEGRDQEFSEDI
jgi:hypothetical protein